MSDLQSQMLRDIRDLKDQISRLKAVEVPVSRGGLWANRPSAPVTSQRYFATDRNLEFFYNGTRWLSIQQYPVDFGNDKSLPITSPAVATSGFAALRGEIPVTGYVTGNSGIQVDAISLDLSDTVASTATNYIQWRYSFVNASAGAAAFTIQIANAQGNAANTYKRFLVLSTPVVIADGTASHFDIQLDLQGAAPSAHTLYVTTAALIRVIG